MESETIKVHHLQGSDNWSVWKFQLRIIFISKGIYNIVTGDHTKPTAPTQEQITADANAFENYQAELREWTKNDGIAQRFIATTIENTPMLHILNCETAHEMWEKLKGVYENKSEATVHMLQQEWFSYSKNPSDDMATHISKLQDLCYKLKIFNENISESMLITKIIMTLPEQYNSFVSAWESTEETQRTIENLTARLIMEESRRKAQEKSQDVALLTKKVDKMFFKKKGQNKSENSKNDHNLRNKNIECYNCKKKGHIKKECWYLEENKNKRPSNFKGSSKAGSSVHNNSDDHALIGEILLAVDPNINTDSWILDSGATSHMCKDKKLFHDYVQLKEAVPVRLGNGTLVPGIGKGNVEIEAYDGKSWVNKCLKDVLYVPDIKFNLFSMGSALSKGIISVSTNFECTFYKNERAVAIAERSNTKELFKMKFQLTKNIEECNAANISKNVNNSSEKECRTEPTRNVNMLQIWHERLAHQNIEYVRSFLTRNDIEVNKSAPFCDACALSKIHRLPFPKSESKTARVGELIHADLCGPMEENSIGNSKYFFLLKDDFSSYIKIYFLKKKSEAVKCFRNFILRIENETGNKINTLRTDNGLEFCNKDMTELTNEFGIKHERTVNYTPEQNGKAERENRSIVEAARAILIKNALNKNLWAESVNAVAYIFNRTRKTKIDGKTPFEIWFNKKADIKHLRVIGTRVYVHIPKQKRLKWDAKGKAGILVGYDENVKAYKILISETNKIESSA